MELTFFRTDHQIWEVPLILFSLLLHLVFNNKKKPAKLIVCWSDECQYKDIINIILLGKHFLFLQV